MGSWRSVSRDWRRALHILISNEYLLQGEIVRESSSFCSKVSSAMRRLHLRVFEKTMPFLHLSE